ncbi:MAG: diacylglycerol O-acyltransferase / wax synthase [Acidobacteriota bacterium]|jgi:WS/DGAT/MGAT family acyltransferase|nr:diacylglycerol O-acyltransferase / wax synthase [Acidobacteriota bacterium]
MTAPSTSPAREPLSSVDFAWLRMDDPTNLMHINGVLVLDQPVTYESIRDIIAQRLLAIPRFRNRVVVPKSGKPYWERDPAFDIANHVGSITLPDPGGDAELRAVVEELISQQFDPLHPMWSFQVIQNFRGGTVVMAKLHHCMGDGVALMLVLLSMTDRTSQAESGARNPFLSLYTRHEQERLHEEHLDLDTIRCLAEEIMPEGMKLMLHPAEAFRKVKGWVKGPAATGALGRLVFRKSDPRTMFKGPLGVAKSVSWSEALSLAEVKAVSKALGATINDVLLAAMTGGLRRYLTKNGVEPPHDLNFRAAMPVNLRTMERMDQLGNQFGLIFLSLPVGIADPAKRLAELKRRSSSLKRSMEPVVVFRILDTLGIVPRKVQDLVVSIFATKATAVMTNVPGPKDVLYLAGKPIQDLYFWVPQAGRVGIGISICSYAGRVRIGVGTDTGLVPDPENIVAGFHEELEAMRRLAGHTGELTSEPPLARVAVP